MNRETQFLHVWRLDWGALREFYFCLPFFFHLPRSSSLVFFFSPFLLEIRKENSNEQHRSLRRLSEHSHNVRPAGPSTFFLFFFGFSDESLFDFTVLFSGMPSWEEQKGAVG